jgi:CBS domain-containing protein
MQVSEVMTPDPACCTPNDPIEKAARLMIENDCGEIPVVGTLDNCQPVGVITDRDITTRTVGRGRDPLRMTVSEVMTTPMVSVAPDADIEKCFQLMEENRIRRLPVVDETDTCVGIVALADIARVTPRKESGEVLKDVSVATNSPSDVDSRASSSF